MKVFTPGSTNAIVASAASSARALPAGGDSAVFYNDGPGVVFVITGASDIVATLPVLNGVVGAAGNATPIPVGASVNLDVRPSHTHYAAICKAGGVADVYCTSGDGF